MVNITPVFSHGLDHAIIAANAALRISNDNPDGLYSDSATPDVIALHEATRKLLTAVENLQNWHYEVNAALRELGVDVPTQI